jgi:hypothetical protein
MFPSWKDRIRITSSLMSLLPVIIVLSLGGPLEYRDYIVIMICMIFSIASVLSALLDRLKDYVLKILKTRKTNKVVKNKFNDWEKL